MPYDNYNYRHAYNKHIDNRSKMTPRNNHFQNSAATRASYYDNRRGINLNEYTSPPQNSNGNFNNDPGTALNDINSKIDNMMTMMSRLVENDKIIHDNVGRINEMDKRVNDIQQMSLNQKMEISGLEIPQDRSTWNAKAAVTAYIQSLGIVLKDFELLHAYVKTKMNKDGPQDILIAEFNHESTKVRLMKEKIAQDKGKEISVYFANVLTSMNRSLLMHAKALKNQNKIHQAFFMGNSVFVLKDESGMRIKIFDHDHLEHVANNANRHADGSNENHSGNNQNPRKQTQRRTNEKPAAKAPATKRTSTQSTKPQYVKKNPPKSKNPRKQSSNSIMSSENED